MKIICLSTLDKFSRFYLDIGNHINKTTNVTLKIYSIHLSGFLYTLVRFKFSCWITLKAWFLAQSKNKKYSKILKNQTSYKGISFDEHIKFHIGLNKKISKTSLQKQALAYIDIFDSIYRNQKPDCIISIGDSRLCIEIALAIAKNHNIKIYYIEQGPFNTTFFDNEGVNANLSIRNRSKDKIATGNLLSSNIDLNANSKKYQRSPLYRGLDILIMKLFERTKAYPPDLKYTDVNSYRLSRLKKNTDSNLSSQNQLIALLICQVPLDVNMVKHSPNYKSHLELLKEVHVNLPSGLELIVREHPLYIGKYDKAFYSYISKNNIKIDNSAPLQVAIDLSKVVIVNNSTVGIEAILKYKTVVVLGNAFYDNYSICIKLKNKDQLKATLKKALDYNVNTTEIDNFKNLLFNTVLLKGAITDKDIISSKLIANQLTANS